MSKLIAKLRDNDTSSEKSSKHHSLSNIFHIHSDPASEELTVKSITRVGRSRSNSANKSSENGGAHFAASRPSRSNRHSLGASGGTTAVGDARIPKSSSPRPGQLPTIQSMNRSLSVNSQPYNAIGNNIGSINIPNTTSALIPRSTSTPLIHVNSADMTPSESVQSSPQPLASSEAPVDAKPTTASKHNSDGFFSTILSAISSPGLHEAPDTDGDHTSNITASSSHTIGDTNNNNNSNNNGNNNNNHNTLFSSKLDFLLKPAKFGKSKSSLPEEDKLDPSPSNSGQVDTNDNDSRSFIGEDIPATSNVHFESIRESPLQTLGTGDLSLHVFEKNSYNPTAAANVKRSDSFVSNSGAAGSSSRHSSSPRNRSTEKIDQLLARNDSLKSNLSPNSVNKQLPSNSQLLVSGPADGKRVKRKSLSIERGASRTLDEDSEDLSSSEENENVNASQVGLTLEDVGVEDYSDFKYASKKRNKEFHQNFKEVPRSERLIDDFSCAISKDILVQGRIYLSPGYVCFNSNILGWVTNVIIPLQEVIQIEKKSTAVVFPNGLVIRTLHQKYVFATFISRDSFFSLITNVWHRVLMEGNEVDPEKLRKRMNTSVSSRRTKLSDEDSFSSEEEDYEDDDDDDEVGEGLVNDEDVDTLELVDNTEDISHPSNGDAQKDGGSPSSGGGGSGGATTGGEASNGDFKGLPIIGPSTHAPTENGYVKGPNDTFICDETLDAPVGVIFRILFGDGTNKYVTILKDQKNFDITEDSIVALSTNNKERKYSYTKPLGGPIGPKQTRCNITDNLIDFSIDSVITVEQVSRTPDVPSGSSFSVKTKLFLSWGPNNSTRLYVVTSIEWTAKSWIKGAIEKGSIDGQKDSMKSMIQTLNKFIKTAQAASSNAGSSNGDKKKKKKRRSTVKREDVPAPPPQEPEPPKTIMAQVSNLFASIGDAVPISIPYVSSTSAGFVYTVIAYLLLLSLGSMLLHLVGLGGGRSVHSLSYGIEKDGVIQSPEDFISRIKINGNEYSIVQTVDSVLSNGRLARNTEMSMWEWIKDRSDGKIDLGASDQPKFRSEPITWSSNYPKLGKKYSKDDIELMLAMTRDKLDEIQQQIL